MKWDFPDFRHLVPHTVSVSQVRACEEQHERRPEGGHGPLPRRQRGDTSNDAGCASAFATSLLWNWEAARVLHSASRGRWARSGAGGSLCSSQGRRPPNGAAGGSRQRALFCRSVIGLSPSARPGRFLGEPAPSGSARRLDAASSKAWRAQQQCVLPRPLTCRRGPSGPGPRGSLHRLTWWTTAAWFWLSLHGAGTCRPLLPEVRKIGKTGMPARRRPVVVFLP